MVHTITLDASSWRTQQDFYDALLPALGAPGWHGENLDALNDSLSSDDMMNEICLPLRIVILGVDRVAEDLREYLHRFEALIVDMRKDGLDIELLWQ